jgi:uncharacterized membrane protein YedE/YeeE
MLMLSFLPSLAGGALIGLSAVLLLVLNGRIAGISGIVGGLVSAIDARLVTNVAFVIGLLLGPLLFLTMFGAWPVVRIETSLPWLGIAGLFVGFGARLRLHVRPWHSRFGSFVAAFHGCGRGLPVDGDGDGLPHARRRCRMMVLRIIAALICGSLFGLGLSISGMLDPHRVRGFLDITGAWDPSLIFVLAGGVIVATIGYRLSRLLPRPLLDRRFDLPTKTAIDAPLLLGSAIFGIGWGIAGICLGPAIALLTLGIGPAFLFVVTMLVGMTAHDRLVPRLISAEPMKGARP